MRDGLGKEGFGSITVEVECEDLPISGEGVSLSTLANQGVSGCIGSVNGAGCGLSYGVGIRG